MDPELYREMAETQQKHWWSRVRREISARLIARLRLPAQAQLLEIGAGAGGNLGMLSRYGTVSAVETDGFAGAYASGVSGVRVSYGRLPDAVPFNDNSFDLVCLLEVLEHIDDDTRVVKRVHRLLKLGGRAVVTVPAYQWLYGAHDRAHHHFRRYTARQLYLKARNAGLRVDRSGHFNALLFPPIAARRLQQIATGEQDSHDAALPSGLLYGIFSAEKYIIPIALFRTERRC